MGHFLSIILSFFQYGHVLFLSVCLSVYTLFYMFSCLSFFLSIFIILYILCLLSSCLSVYLSFCLLVFLSTCLSVYLYFCLLVFMSNSLSVYLSSCCLSVFSLIVFLSICLSFFLVVYLSNCLQSKCPPSTETCYVTTLLPADAAIVVSDQTPSTTLKHFDQKKRFEIKNKSSFNKTNEMILKFKQKHLQQLIKQIELKTNQTK